MLHITVPMVNGLSTYTDKNGNLRVHRKCLERAVLDMLEDNDYYGNLDFCDAELVCEVASEYELVLIYNEMLDPKRVRELLENA